MRRTIMSFDKNDVKHGIDNVASHLKDAVDSIAEKTSDSREKLTQKAKEVARKTGDEMIEKGHKLKNAADAKPTPAEPEKTTA
jgi:hypothetical protein